MGRLPSGFGGFIDGVMEWGRAGGWWDGRVWMYWKGISYMSSFWSYKAFYIQSVPISQDFERIL